MKLALAHYSSPADISGVTTWFERLAMRLHNDGVNLAVHLHHFGRNPDEASLLPSLRDGGVPVEVVSRQASLRADVVQTLGFLNRYQPTVFLPQCLNAHYFAAAIAGKQCVPWALTMHSDDPDYWGIASLRRPAAYGGTLVCVSEHIALLAAERGLGVGSPVIPYGVDVPSQFATYSSEPFRVVYSGRLVELQKRMSLVIATLIHACLRDPRIVATVIGDGPALIPSRETVAKAGLTQRITFIGRLAPERVKLELLSAQAILLMSDFEGLPVALLEAMAAGVVPVVRFIPSGIPELVQHERTGLLGDDRPENVAGLLVRLAHDASLWQRCSVAGRELVAQHYSADVCYRRWLALVQELDSRSAVRYPLRIPWRLNLPRNDPGYGGGNAPARPLWRRAASRLKQGLTDTGRKLLAK